MRIACLHVPSFILQVHARAAPHLMGTSFVVLSAGDPGHIPRVVACSRAARDAGVRIGLTATQARAVSAETRILDGTPAAYVHAMQALGEAALALSVTVDIRTPGRVHALVPPGKGERWGEALLQAATRVGFQARVGIADDRFTAWAATQQRPHARLRIVPAGGAARFLAPLGLELLPLDEEVRRMLILLGVRTLGDYAALPPPSVGRRWAGGAVDAQALASGADRTPLVAYLPSEPVRETLELEGPVTELEPLAFVLRPLCERVLMRLSGRARAAARVGITLAGDGRATQVVISPTQPTTSARTLVDLARAHLAEKQLDHAVLDVTVTVLDEGEAVATELELFPRDDDAPDVAAVDTAVARLHAVFGADAASGAQLVSRHRPEGAFARVPFAPPVTAARRGQPRKKKKEPPRVLPVVARGGIAALRLLDPPPAVETDGAVVDEDPPRPPRSIHVDGQSRRVVDARGPTRLEGEWWTDEPLARDYFEVETEDGGRYWLYRDHADGLFYLHGVFD